MTGTIALLLWAASAVAVLALFVRRYLRQRAVLGYHAAWLGIRPHQWESNRSLRARMNQRISTVAGRRATPIGVLARILDPDTCDAIERSSR